MIKEYSPACVEMEGSSIEELPLMVIPSLAARISLNEAVILQQMHYWVSISKHVIEGKRWIFNTYKEWQNVPQPSVSYSYAAPVYQGCFPVQGCGEFILIVVLFILLIVVGAVCFY